MLLVPVDYVSVPISSMQYPYPVSILIQVIQQMPSFNSILTVSGWLLLVKLGHQGYSTQSADITVLCEFSIAFTNISLLVCAPSSKEYIIIIRTFFIIKNLISFNTSTKMVVN